MTDEQVIAWFVGMSTANKFGAAMNPSGWATAQTAGIADAAERERTAVEFERRANIWKHYMLALADEPTGGES